MGLKLGSFIKRDPDPLINREQSKIFNELVNELSRQFEKSPSYRQASDLEKAAMWEEEITGPDGIAAFSHEAALEANPDEAVKRDLKRGIGPLRQQQMLKEDPNVFGVPKK